MGIDWQAVRAEFPVTGRCVYLNTGWSAPSPRRAVEAMQRRLEREAYDGPTSLDVRHEKGMLVQAARHAFASLIGAGDDEIALTYTTTDGVNTILRGIGLQVGDRVVTCNLEHNAVMVPSYVSRMRDGLELTIVRLAPEDGEAAVIEAFDRAITPDTKLLLVSHISYNRGTRLPIARLAEIAHARGAFVAVDAAQSAGQVPLDARALGCDAMMFPGHKWLLGPDGAAALYIRRELVERVQPLAVVHGANRRYDFEGNFEYANDTMHKFELTTHSGPVLAGLFESMSFVTSIGLDAVEARCMVLADRFIDGLRAIAGVRITTPLDRALRSGIVTFAVDGLAPGAVAASLWHSDRIVTRVCNDRRVRACFHVFNDEADVDRTLAAVERIASSGVAPGSMDDAAYKEMLLESDD